MKRVILDWFNQGYYPEQNKKKQTMFDRVTVYLENKDVIIKDDGDKQKAIHWTRELSYEYSPETKSLKERLNAERFQKDMIVYNFDDYNLKTHVIGRLEQLSNGKEDSPEKQMVCKIIDFSFVENKSNIKLDGKACMSYNKAPMNKLMTNLDLDVVSTDKRGDQCNMIELALRKYNREHTDGKIWWIESTKIYKLEKIL